MILRHAIPLILVLISCWAARAEESELICFSTTGHAAAAPPSGRSYSPDRRIDILRLSLDVTPDFAERTVSGMARLRFVPIATAIEELSLDAVDLNVKRVGASIPVQAYQVLNDRIQITFAEPLPPGIEQTVEIEYDAAPVKGLYFRTAELGYPAEETHLFTQGEAIEARHWYPCYDAPNEKFSSEIRCWVPEGMTVLSNGIRVSEERDSERGLVGVRWVQEKPHVNYLLSLVAGYFSRVEDRYKDIPLAFYVSPSDLPHAWNSFRETKEMMGFFEREIGVPYPWEKYFQVTVKDFMFGGMENTSVTTLTDRTLFPDSTENLRSSRGLVAHELAHQWFGDLVTCKDWSHLWLNEGFATYYALLQYQHAHGTEAMRYALHESAQGLIRNATDKRPMVYRKYDEPIDMIRSIGHLIYQKGAWVLHMLRSELGHDLYRKCIRVYLERHQFGTVVTQDLIAVIEEITGRSYDRFFDQWVYHGGIPSLTVRYSWDEKLKLAKVSVQQTHAVSEEVLLFEVPLAVRFITEEGPADRTLRVTQKSEDFYVPLSKAPRLVRIDPDVTLLAAIQFEMPQSMLDAQLAQADDALGRIKAVEVLKRRKNAAAIRQLTELLQEDPFHGVRIEASRALREAGDEGAFAALRSALDQPDARVRKQVVSDALSFYRPESVPLALEVIERERNPEIAAEAIGALAGYRGPEVVAALTSRLGSESFRDIVASAAIQALAKQHDARHIPALLETLRRREAEFTSDVLRRGFSALATLGNPIDEKTEILEFLVRHASGLHPRLQSAALDALGTLGDPRAIAVVEKFARGAPDLGSTAAAKRAIEKLRAAKPIDAGLSTVQRELFDLQKKSKEMEEQMEELRKKLEAVGGTR